MVAINKWRTQKVEKINMKNSVLIGAAILITLLSGNFTFGAEKKRKPTVGFFLVDGFLGLFDKGDYIAHAEDAGGHSVGVEGFEVVHLLTDTCETDRHAGDVLHGEGCSAARVSVELC